MSSNIGVFDALIYALLLLIMLGSVFIWYRQPSDVVIVAICSGLITSTITGLALIGIRSARERMFDSVSATATSAIALLQQITSWHEGTWVEYIPTNNTGSDPIEFWFTNRLSRAESNKTLIMIGRTHSFMFEESSDANRAVMIEAIKRVVEKKGRVWFFFAEDAPTISRAITYLSSNLKKEAKAAVEVYSVPRHYALNYSCLMNDVGVWVTHKPICLPSDRSYLAVIRRKETPYYYHLITSDSEAIRGKATRLEIS